MQAPRLRLNERQANPNPYIIFIRSLKHKKNYVDAEDMLRAVAAQMKTIMKDRFMQIHTLQEAGFNRVFAGRNWNHGQSIELVLRGPTGRFLPMPYIISVMCHEMAHIEQMNHGPNFQKLMNDIKADVSRLQARGYYGDGFWSDGKRLRDSERMGVEGFRPSDFPEYVCGVNAADAKKAKKSRRGSNASLKSELAKGQASRKSGRQTDYKRKDGRRNNVDMGEIGMRLDGVRAIMKQDREDRKAFIDQQVESMIREGITVTAARRKANGLWERKHPWWAESNTRSKVARSKAAANLRAEAAEARLRAFASSSNDLKVEQNEPSADTDGENSSSDNHIEEIPDPQLSVEERKRQLDTMDDSERDGLRGGWEEFVKLPIPKIDPDTKPCVFVEKRPFSSDITASSFVSAKQRKTSDGLPSRYLVNPARQQCSQAFDPA
ncbi:hypothetical protein L204_100623 [Cryptococcus depauperatus]